MLISERFEHVEEMCKILNYYDPMGLIICGAPLDEYSPEALIIYFGWRDSFSFDNFNGFVYSVFVKQFGSVRLKNSESFIQISKELWSYLKKSIE